MKKLNSILFLAVAAIMAICVGASCSSDSDEDLNNFNAAFSTKFHSIIDTLKAKNYNYVIVDGRTKALYDAGHIKGAVNYEVTAQNTIDNNAAFPTWLNANYPIASGYYVLVYGCGSLSYAVGGRISKCGYGKAHTYYLNDSYDTWAKTYPNEIEK